MSILEHEYAHLRDHLHQYNHELLSHRELGMYRHRYRASPFSQK